MNINVYVDYIHNLLEENTSAENERSTHGNDGLLYLQTLFHSRSISQQSQHLSKYLHRAPKHRLIKPTQISTEYKLKSESWIH